MRDSTPLTISPPPLRAPNAGVRLVRLLPALTSMVAMGATATVAMEPVITTLLIGTSLATIAVSAWSALGEQRGRRADRAALVVRYREHLLDVASTARRSLDAARIELETEGPPRGQHPPPAPSTTPRLRLHLGTADVPSPFPALLQLDPLADYDPELLAAARATQAALGIAHSWPQVLDLPPERIDVRLDAPGVALAWLRSALLHACASSGPDDLRILGIGTSDPGRWGWLHRAAQYVGLETEDPSLAQRVRSSLPLGDVVRTLILIDADRCPQDVRPLLTHGAAVLIVSSDEGPRAGAAVTVEAHGDELHTIRANARVITVPASVPRRAAGAVAIDSVARWTPTHAAVERPALPTTPVELAASWTATADAGQRLRFRIGRAADGSSAVVDVRQAAEGGAGPHGILTGPTGSGKSELLRTLLAEAIATSHPSELQLLLVDFKGGAALDAFAGAPHCAGLLTNLGDDPSEARRMAEGLMKEIDRRQAALRSCTERTGREVPDVAALRTFRKERNDLPELADLLVVVDEFTELLRRHPDTVNAFEALARLGRSLGIHLLLSSQVASGELTRVTRHASLRICLRTPTADESLAAIGSTTAHRLPARPGAGVLCDGTTEVLFDGARTEAATVRNLVEHACQLAHDAPRTRVWAPPLPRELALDDIAGIGAEIADLPFGLVDACSPDGKNEPATIDLSGATGGILVLGGPAVGKSTTLRTIAMRASTLTSPPMTYVLQGRAQALTSLTALRHVGEVVQIGDADGIDALIDVLRDRADQRPSSPGGLPPLLVLVDDWGELVDAHPTATQQMLDLLPALRRCGTVLALATCRATDLRAEARAHLPQVIELSLAEPMQSVIDHRSAAQVRSYGIPGRFLDRSGRVGQVALPARTTGDRQQPFDPAEGSDGTSHTATAPPLPRLPLRSDADLVASADALPLLTCGIDWTRTMATLSMDGRYAHAVALGDPGMGKTNLLTNWMAAFALSESQDAMVAVIDPRRQVLEPAALLERSGRLLGYSANPGQVAPVVDRLAAELASRAADDPDTSRPSDLLRRAALRRSPIVLVVDDLRALSEVAPRALEALLPYVGQGPQLSFHVLLSHPMQGTPSMSYGDGFLQRVLQHSPRGLVFGSCSGTDPWAPIGKVANCPRPPGRAVLVEPGAPSRLLQVPIASGLPRL